MAVDYLTNADAANVLLTWNCLPADYMRSAIRMAALSHAGSIFVMTHDSIGLGEDGPTHQPIEHLASFRAMPNILMLRPGDGNETAGAYKVQPSNAPAVLPVGS